MVLFRFSVSSICDLLCACLSLVCQFLLLYLVIDCSIKLAKHPKGRGIGPELARKGGAEFPLKFPTFVFYILSPVAQNSLSIIELV